MQLSNKVYDALKWVAQYFIPALGTLYFTVSGIWGLPYGEEVLGTLTAVDLFLAALLGLSNSSYKKTGTDGTLFVDQTDESKDIVRMQFNIDPVDMATKKTVTLSVDNSQRLSSTSSPQE